jgi:hypothetical protein
MAHRFFHIEPDHKNQIWPVNLEMYDLKNPRIACKSKNISSRMWDFTLVHQAKLMQFLPFFSYRVKTAIKTAPARHQICPNS